MEAPRALCVTASFHAWGEYIAILVKLQVEYAQITAEI